MNNQYKVFVIVGIVIGISLGILFGVKTSESLIYEESYKDDQSNGIPFLTGKTTPFLLIPASQHKDLFTSQSWRHPSMPSSIDKPEGVPTVYSFFEDGTFEIQWHPGLNRPDTVGIYKLVPYSNSHGILLTIQNDNTKQVMPYEIRGEDRIIVNFDYLGKLETKYELHGHPPIQLEELLDERNVEETFPLWFAIHNSTWKAINPKTQTNDQLIEMEFSNGKYIMRTSDGSQFEGPYGIFDNPKNLLTTYRLTNNDNPMDGKISLGSIPLKIEDDILIYGDGKFSVKLKKQS